jgi:hypothetical protein
MEAIAVDDALKRSHHADLALLGRLVGIQFLDDFQDSVKVTLPQMPHLVLLMDGITGHASWLWVRVLR